MLQKIKNRRAESGFTLVELLIVIVVIAILAAIAITAFAGVQAQARDTQRVADIDQIQSQLELYYTDKAKFPTNSDMTGTVAAVTGIFPGLGPDALEEPQDDTGDGNSFTNTPPTAAGSYSYVATPAGCDNGTGGDCTSYTLTYWSETKEGGAGTISVEDVSGV